MISPGRGLFMRALAIIISFLMLLPLMSCDFTDSQHTEKININEASTEALQTLPGIGPALAERIVEYRTDNPFETIEDLMGVSGIGQSSFEPMKHLITVDPPQEEAPQ